MGASVGKYVKCPYYRENLSKEQRRLGHLRCEGVSNDNSIHLVFGCKAREREYMEKHCYSISGCKSCLIYRCLALKYTD